MRLPVGLLARCAFWCALVFAYVCAILPSGPEIGGSDKATHMLAFATLAFLARFGWPRAKGWRIVALLVLFGVGIELSQALPIIHRDAELRDVVADLGGTLVGLVAAWIGAIVLARLNWRVLILD